MKDDKNNFAIALIRSVGASAEEVTRIYCHDVYDECSDIMVWVGCGMDKRLVKALDDTPWLLAQLAERLGHTTLVQEKPDDDDAESAQGHFAWEMYQQYATGDISQVPECRRVEGYNGEYYDEAVLEQVADQMGGYAANHVAYLISRK